MAVNRAFVNALLADATYALASNNLNGITGSSLENLSGIRDRMTPTLAKYLGEHFTVVTHIEIDDVFDSGFDATVWKDNTSGQITVSMRGSEGLQDFLTDASLAVTGDARKQIVDMVNWWFKITTPVGQNARQIQLEPQYDSGTPPVLLGTHYIAAPDASGAGLVSATDLARGIEVNGHSLGGFLATAFTRLFGAQAHVMHTSTFNSAGFAPGSEAVFEELQNLIGPSYGLGRFPNAAEQANHFAAHGLNVTTNSLYFNQAGQRVELEQEEGTGFPNHYMYKLTDMLALGVALEKLDPTLNIEKLNELVEAGSNRVEASLEGVLDALRRMFNPASERLPVGDASSSASTRLAYHETLAQWQKSPVFTALAGGVKLKPVSEFVNLSSHAKTDFAVFLALHTLSPVVMSTQSPIAEAALQAANQSLAIAWEADKNARLYGDTRYAYTFSDAWYEDRATVLLAEAYRHEHDHSDFDVLTPLPSSGILAGRYEDHDSATVIQVGLNLNATRKVEFGSALGGSSLVGGAGGDRLYGAAGSDSLIGLAGSDHLEGGSGSDVLDGGADNDVLNGGTGFDTYRFEAENWGHDVIIDADGSGRIQLGGITLGEFKRLPDSGGVWVDESETYLLFSVYGGGGGTDLRLVHRGHPDTATITIRNWSKSRNLGITFEEDEEAAPELPPSSDDRSFNGISAYTGGDAYDDPRTMGFNEAALRPTLFVAGTSSNDRLSAYHTGAVLTGGAGHDLLVTNNYQWDPVHDPSFQSYYVMNYGLFDDDGLSIAYQIPVDTPNNMGWRLRHADNVTLLGGPGDDVLDGTGGGDYRQFYVRFSLFDGGTGNDTISVYGMSNLLDGGAGDDGIGVDGENNILVGGEGSDTLSVTGDNNILLGGEGNDSLIASFSSNSILNGGAGNDTIVVGGFPPGPTPETNITPGSHNTIVYNPGDGRDVVSAYFGATLQVNGSSHQMHFGRSFDPYSGRADGDDLVLTFKGDDESSVTVLYYFHEERIDQWGRLDSHRPLLKLSGAIFDYERVVKELNKGGNGADLLWGVNDVVNEMFGGAGSDTLTAGKLDDTLHGGTGDDELHRGKGVNTFVFNKGDGHDTLHVDSFKTAGVNRDVLKLGGGLTPAVTRAVRGQSANGYDLILMFGDGDQVTLKRYFENHSRLSSIQFEGGAQWGFAEVVARLNQGGAGDDTLRGMDGMTNQLFGAGGNDTLTAGNLNDTLAGGPGNDTLNAGVGINTFVFNRGDGQDVIYTFHKTGGINQDVLQLGAGLMPANVLLTRGASTTYFDLTLDFGGGDQITLKNYLLDPYGLKTIAFADGTQWDRAEVSRLMAGIDTGSNDALMGTAQNDVLDGRSGDDVLIGGGGNDVLIGGAGRDTLMGGDQNDVLDGGPGDDSLMGEGGDDRYLFGLGGGRDSIIESSGNDRIVFGSGIASSQITASLTNGSSGQSRIKLSISPGDWISFTARNSVHEIEHFEFADGSVLGADWLNGLLNPAPLSPIGTDKSLTLQEDTAHTITLADLGFVAATAGDTLSAVRIDTPPQAGSLQLDGNPVSAGQVISVADLAAGRLVFTPAANAHGNGHASLGFSVAGQGGAFDATPNALNFHVSPVNDAPIVVNPLPDIASSRLSGQTYALPTNTFTDPDGDPLSYSVAMADGSALPYWIKHSMQAAQSLLEVGSNSAVVPSVQLRLTATDTSGAQASSAFTVHITPDGILPTFSGTSTTLADGVRHLNLTGDAAIGATGNALDNQLVGNGASNILIGLHGDDALDGGTGADVLMGGQGNDIYFVDDAGDQVIELDAEGTADQVYASIHYTLPEHVEALAVVGSADLNATGNALNNKLFGNTGANVLDGRAGADNLRGFAGNDTYVIDHAGDMITELATEGAMDVAQLWISFSFLALSANRIAAVERIELMGSDALSATGNSRGQQIVGNGAANELRGGGGSDVILGGGGDDRLVIGTAERAGLGSSRYDGGSGNDTLALASDQSGVLLDFSAYGQATFTGIERIDITGGGNNTARFTMDQLLGMPDAGESRLIVLGDAGDTVALLGGSGNWSSLGTQHHQGRDYETYAHSGAAGRELFVQQGVGLVML